MHFEARRRRRSCSHCASSCVVSFLLSAVENMSDELEYRCFIGGLAWSTSDRGLKDAFAKFGHLVEAKVVPSEFAFIKVMLYIAVIACCLEGVIVHAVAVDKFSGRSRGFGFITFDEKTAMEEAIEAMNGMDLDGRSITVEKAQPSGRDRDSDRPQMEIDLGDVTGIPVAMVEAIVIIVTVLDPMTAGVPEVSDPAEEIGGSATGCEAVGSSFSNDTFSQCLGKRNNVFSRRGGNVAYTAGSFSISSTEEIWQFQEF
ncbi:hypothetical protein C3L33_22205, partial [Rhododendron williamsianum]